MLIVNMAFLIIKIKDMMITVFLIVFFSLLCSVIVSWLYVWC